MATIRIPPGFVRGDARAAVPGRYSEGNLIRWQNGVLKPVGGWERRNLTAFGSIPRWAYVWLDNSFSRWQATLCDGNVYVDDGEDITEITPTDWRNADKLTGGYGSGRYGMGPYGLDDGSRNDAPDVGEETGREAAAFPVSFSADRWGPGELLFGSSTDGRVLVWDPAVPDGPPVICTNAPTLIQCFLVTEEQHLMTFGGNQFPNRVAWSDQGNREGWDYVDVDGQAGFFDLQDAGLIYSARNIPGGILIFTQTSVWLGRYIGQPNYYGFTKLADSVAPISPQSVVVAGTRTYWWGSQSFHKYEGGIVASVPCDLGTSPFDELNNFWAPRRVSGGYNGNYPEIWWYYPSGDNQENDKYVVFNFVEGWWADGYQQRTFFISSPIDRSPIAGSKEGAIFYHERGFLDNGGARASAGMIWAQVKTLSFDDGDHLWSVNQMQPDTRGEATDVRFDFDIREARGGPNLYTEQFTCRDDGYCDARFTAREFTLRIYPTRDKAFGVGALNFDVAKRGKR